MLPNAYGSDYVELQVTSYDGETVIVARNKVFTGTVEAQLVSYNGGTFSTSGNHPVKQFAQAVASGIASGKRFNRGFADATRNLPTLTNPDFDAMPDQQKALYAHTKVLVATPGTSPSQLRAIAEALSLQYGWVQGNHISSNFERMETKSSIPITSVKAFDRTSQGEVLVPGKGGALIKKLKLMERENFAKAAMHAAPGHEQDLGIEYVAFAPKNSHLFLGSGGAVAGTVHQTAGYTKPYLKKAILSKFFNLSHLQGLNSVADTLNNPMEAVYVKDPKTGKVMRDQEGNPVIKRRRLYGFTGTQTIAQSNGEKLTIKATGYQGSIMRGGFTLSLGYGPHSVNQIIDSIPEEDRAKLRTDVITGFSSDKGNLDSQKKITDYLSNMLGIEVTVGGANGRTAVKYELARVVGAKGHKDAAMKVGFYYDDKRTSHLKTMGISWEMSPDDVKNTYALRKQITEALKDATVASKMIKGQAPFTRAAGILISTGNFDQAYKALVEDTTKIYGQVVLPIRAGSFTPEFSGKQGMSLDVLKAISRKSPELARELLDEGARNNPQLEFYLALTNQGGVEWHNYSRADNTRLSQPARLQQLRAEYLKWAEDEHGAGARPMLRVGRTSIPRPTVMKYLMAPGINGKVIEKYISIFSAGNSVEAEERARDFQAMIAPILGNEEARKGMTSIRGISGSFERYNTNFAAKQDTIEVNDELIAKYAQKLKIAPHRLKEAILAQEKPLYASVTRQPFLGDAVLLRLVYNPKAIGPVFHPYFDIEMEGDRDLDPVNIDLLVSVSKTGTGKNTVTSIDNFGAVQGAVKAQRGQSARALARLIAFGGEQDFRQWVDKLQKRLPAGKTVTIDMALAGVYGEVGGKSVYIPGYAPNIGGSQMNSIVKGRQGHIEKYEKEYEENASGVINFAVAAEPRATPREVGEASIEFNQAKRAMGIYNYLRSATASIESKRPMMDRAFSGMAMRDTQFGLSISPSELIMQSGFGLYQMPLDVQNLPRPIQNLFTEFNVMSADADPATIARQHYLDLISNETQKFKDEKGNLIPSNIVHPELIAALFGKDAEDMKRIYKAIVEGRGTGIDINFAETSYAEMIEAKRAVNFYDDLNRGKIAVDENGVHTYVQSGNVISPERIKTIERTTQSPLFNAMQVMFRRKGDSATYGRALEKDPLTGAYIDRVRRNVMGDADEREDVPQQKAPSRKVSRYYSTVTGGNRNPFSDMWKDMRVRPSNVGYIATAGGGMAGEYNSLSRSVVEALAGIDANGDKSLTQVVSIAQSLLKSMEEASRGATDTGNAVEAAIAASKNVKQNLGAHFGQANNDADNLHGNYNGLPVKGMPDFLDLAGVKNNKGVIDISQATVTIHDVKYLGMGENAQKKIEEFNSGKGGYAAQQMSYMDFMRQEAEGGTANAPGTLGLRNKMAAVLKAKGIEATDTNINTLVNRVRGGHMQADLFVATPDEEVAREKNASWGKGGTGTFTNPIAWNANTMPAQVAQTYRDAMLNTFHASSSLESIIGQVGAISGPQEVLSKKDELREVLKNIRAGGGGGFGGGQSAGGGGGGGGGMSPDMGNQMINLLSSIAKSVAVPRKKGRKYYGDSGSFEKIASRLDTDGELPVLRLVDDKGDVMSWEEFQNLPDFKNLGQYEKNFFRRIVETQAETTEDAEHKPVFASKMHQTGTQLGQLASAGYNVLNNAIDPQGNAIQRSPETRDKLTAVTGKVRSYVNANQDEFTGRLRPRPGQAGIAQEIFDKNPALSNYQATVNRAKSIYDRVNAKVQAGKSVTRNELSELISARETLKRARMTLRGSSWGTRVFGSEAVNDTRSDDLLANMESLTRNETLFGTVASERRLNPLGITNETSPERQARLTKAADERAEKAEARMAETKAAKDAAFMEHQNVRAGMIYTDKPEQLGGTRPQYKSDEQKASSLARANAEYASRLQEEVEYQTKYGPQAASGAIPQDVYDRVLREKKTATLVAKQQADKAHDTLTPVPGGNTESQRSYWATQQKAHEAEAAHAQATAEANARKAEAKKARDDAAQTGASSPWSISARARAMNPSDPGGRSMTGASSAWAPSERLRRISGITGTWTRSGATGVMADDINVTEKTLRSAGFNPSGMEKFMSAVTKSAALLTEFNNALGLTDRAAKNKTTPKKQLLSDFERLFDVQEDLASGRDTLAANARGDKRKMKGVTDALDKTALIRNDIGQEAATLIRQAVDSGQMTEEEAKDVMKQAKGNTSRKRQNAGLSNKLLSGIFAMNVLRDLRYTVGPIESLAQQSMASDISSDVALNQGGAGISLAGANSMYANQIRMRNNMLSAGSPAMNVMSGINGIGAAITDPRTLGGAFGVAASIGLPALGAGVLGASTLPSLFEGLTAGPAFAGVAIPAAMALGGAYLYGASSDTRGQVADARYRRLGGSSSGLGWNINDSAATVGKGLKNATQLNGLGVLNLASPGNIAVGLMQAYGDKSLGAQSDKYVMGQASMFGAPKGDISSILDTISTEGSYLNKLLPKDSNGNALIDITEARKWASTVYARNGTNDQKESALRTGFDLINQGMDPYAALQSGSQYSQMFEGSGQAIGVNGLTNNPVAQAQSLYQGGLFGGTLGMQRMQAFGFSSLFNAIKTGSVTQQRMSDRFPIQQPNKPIAQVVPVSGGGGGGKKALYSPVKPPRSDPDFGNVAASIRARDDSLANEKRIYQFQSGNFSVPQWAFYEPDQLVSDRNRNNIPPESIGPVNNSLVDPSKVIQDNRLSDAYYSRLNAINNPGIGPSSKDIGTTLKGLLGTAGAFAGVFGDAIGGAANSIFNESGKISAAISGPGTQPYKMQNLTINTDNALVVAKNIDRSLSGVGGAAGALSILGPGGIAAGAGAFLGYNAIKGAQFPNPFEYSARISAMISGANRQVSIGPNQSLFSGAQGAAGSQGLFSDIFGVAGSGRFASGGFIGASLSAGPSAAPLQIAQAPLTSKITPQEFNDLVRNKNSAYTPSVDFGISLPAAGTMGSSNMPLAMRGNGPNLSKYNQDTVRSMKSLGLSDTEIESALSGSNYVAPPVSPGMQSPTSGRAGDMGVAGAPYGASSLTLQNNQYTGPKPVEFTEFESSAFNALMGQDPYTVSKMLSTTGGRFALSGTALSNMKPTWDIGKNRPLGEASFMGLVSNPMSSVDVGNFIGYAPDSRMAQAAAGNVYKNASGQAMGGLTAMSLVQNETMAGFAYGGIALSRQELDANRGFEMKYTRPNTILSNQMANAGLYGGTVTSGGITADFGTGSLARQMASYNLGIEQQQQSWTEQRASQDWGIQDLRRSMSRLPTQDLWQRQDFATTAQKMQNDRSMQRYQFGYEAQSLSLNRQYTQEDYGYNKQKANLQFGWQMEDADINIRRSTGFERRQLVKQKGRESEMYNIDMAQMDKVKTRQDKEYTRQAEMMDKQIKHYEKSIKIEDTEFKRSQDRFEQQVKWRDEDNNIRLSHLLTQRGWLETNIGLQEKGNKLQLEEITASQGQQKIEMDMRNKTMQGEFDLSDKMYGLQKQRLDLAAGEIAAQQEYALKVAEVEDAIKQQIADNSKMFADTMFLGLVKLFAKLGIDITGNAADSGGNVGRPGFHLDGQGNWVPDAAIGGVISPWTKTDELGPEERRPAGAIYALPNQVNTPGGYGNDMIEVRASAPIVISGKELANVIIPFLIDAAKVTERRRTRR